MSIPVSVILPTHNRAHLLPRAIGSVLAQSFTDFELIIIDDGSQDDTAALVAAIRDSRVHYLCRETKSGVAAARNMGIDASTGRYLAFQDSDDEWLPHKLARQVEAWRTAAPETAIVYTQFWRQKGERRTLFPPDEVRLSGDIQKVLLRQNVITTQAALVRRDRLVQVGGFDEQLPCLVDWELWLRLASVSRFHFLPDPSVTVHFTPESVSTRDADLADALSLILQKHAALFQGKPGLLAHHHYQIGHLRCMSGNSSRGISHLATAVQLAPRKLRYRLTWSIAHLGTTRYRQIYRWKTVRDRGWY